MLSVEPTERFSNRVESYRRYRPRYPEGIVELLEDACRLSSDAIIADIAAGTGLLAEMFLAHGYAVTAIEPNEPMRAACATLISSFPRLCCIDGTAEATGLPDKSVDLITVGQAMHWFDLARARAEFSRVLRPAGWCAVLYNNRRMSGDAFHEGYEKILVDFGSDYEAVRDSHLDENRLAAFFAPRPMRTANFENSQQLDLDALTGRILSSSYMPQPGQPRYEKMSRAVADLFAQYETSGHVRMDYDCAICYGQLT
jgi:SAM-dependent methyltransferase